MAYKQVSGIYEIRFGRYVYYGSAVCTTGRLNQHKRMLRNGVHDNFVLQRMWDKHGDRAVFRVVEECARDELRKREQYYIDSRRRGLLNLAKQVCELAPPEVHSQRMKRAWAKRSDESRAAMSEKISSTLKDRYKNDPKALSSARAALKAGRKAGESRKTSTEANAKRSLAMKLRWANRSDTERASVAAKISNGMMVKMTAEERSEKARAGGYACRGSPKTRKPFKVGVEI